MGIAQGFPRKLVVTADDFGAAREVNEAVELAHTRGILTAASLMMSGAAVGDAVARARRLPASYVRYAVIAIGVIAWAGAQHLSRRSVVK